MLKTHACGVLRTEHGDLTALIEGDVGALRTRAVVWKQLNHRPPTRHRVVQATLGAIIRVGQQTRAAEGQPDGVLGASVDAGLQLCADLPGGRRCIKARPVQIVTRLAPY